MNMSYIVAPLVGAFIGYITNYIAIKMLFRPLEAKYILGLKLPFTPGIIPREKDRLAKSIGSVIGENLLNDEIIMKVLTSSHFRQQIENFIDQKLLEIKSSTQSIGCCIDDVLDSKESLKIVTTLKGDITDFLYNKINSQEVIEKLTDHVAHGLDSYLEKQTSNPALKVILGLNKKIIDSVKNMVTAKITDVIYTDSYAVISSLVEDELKKLLNTQVNTLPDRYDQKIPEIKNIAINSFHKIVRNNIHIIASALNIASVVENRIQDFDVLEIEQLILSVVDKELKAIIWLGALLGFLMGFLMPLFS